MKWQPYPNVPVYVVCPIDGEGCSHTLHRNYLLPISNKLEQEEGENAVEGGGSNKPTPVPHAEDALLVKWPTKSWPEGMPNSPSKQWKLVNPGSSGLTSPDSAGGGFPADNDMPVPLRWTSRTMSNQLQWRYQNLALWQNYILPGAFNMWGWPVHLPTHHVMPVQHFHGEHSVKTLYLNHHRSARHKWFLALKGTPLMLSLWWIIGWGSGPKDIWSKYSCPTRKTKG